MIRGGILPDCNLPVAARDLRPWSLRDWCPLESIRTHFACHWALCGIRHMSTMPTQGVCRCNYMAY
jgi:hypothetical protein